MWMKRLLGSTSEGEFDEAISDISKGARVCP